MFDLSKYLEYFHFVSIIHYCAKNTYTIGIIFKEPFILLQHMHMHIKIFTFHHSLSFHFQNKHVTHKIHTSTQ